jgi:hypothetical protein
MSKPLINEINEINQSIMFGKWTNEHLESMLMAVKFARSQLGKQNKRSFMVNDTVKFVARGREVRGQVVKIMQKNVKVREGMTVWRVPANMIEAA